MEQSFTEALEERVILFDGAMGTEIYGRGVFFNRCYDELNVASPEIIREIHASYVKAGADVLTTNTFGANRSRLQPFGLEGRIAEINHAGVALARAVAGDQAWVAASVGPLGVALSPLGRLSPGDAFQQFREQATFLEEAGCDLFVLETFTTVAELWQAFRAVRSVSEKPIVTLMSFRSQGMVDEKLEGESPEWAARTIAGWKPAALGVNCSAGPKQVLEIVERMVRSTDARIAAQPNAGLPQVVDGRTIYLAGPEYMAEYARRLVQKGASIVGGCCGTNPSVIREMRTYLASVSTRIRRPVTVTSAEPSGVVALQPVPARERSEFARKVTSGAFCVSVELDPPRGVDVTHVLEGATLLKAAGVDVVNIADGPRAVARMDPSSLAQLVRAHCGMESIVHYCCRDRNILGIQMDLLGNHAIGLHNILAVTGDPPKMGSYPHAKAVFDIDSIGLVTFVQMLNRGLDFSGQPVGGQTALFVGAGCNPGNIDPDLEVERFGRKVAAGAEFFFSQPVFEPEMLGRFLDRVASCSSVPFFAGIMPLVSYKNAEFLHNEVPGMQIPQLVRDRLKHASSRDAQRTIGVEIAREMLRELRTDRRVSGVYVFPPFGSYPAVLKLLEVL
jgi:methionine synthase / methylenetetrahydrofolate reductase(NADPH)